MPAAFARYLLNFRALLIRDRLHFRRAANKVGRIADADELAEDTLNMVKMPL
jgi:hypothetical protein